MRASRRSFAIACFVSAACSRSEPPAPAPAPLPASAFALAPASSSASASPSASAPGCAMPSVYDSPIAVKPIGHTSLVLKLRFGDDRAASFKPRSRFPLGATRYKAEIAAYRLARALGLSNVPVAMPQTYPVAVLRDLLNKASAGARADDLFPDGDGIVRGALMPWIKYDVWPLEREPLKSRYDGWLTSRAAEIPDAEKSRARQVSTLVVFDYLTANWDRWSGGNVALDATTDTVLFVDNDGAFYEAPDATNLADQLAHVRRMTRFSKSFVKELRAMTLQKLEAAIGDEMPGLPLLSKKVLEMTDERRMRALKAIDAKIAEAGEADVLVFD